MDDEKIYFLDFTFNPKTRTLQKNENIIQLRKKQADVLILLCTKYPEPVSQEDFLAGAWEGGYVTSQSIAQVIRSLRLNLEDINKSIIVTIPKLGYQFTALPSHKEPASDNYPYQDMAQLNIGIDNFTLNRLSRNDSTTISLSSKTKKSRVTKKIHSIFNFSKVRKIIFFSIAVIFAVVLLFLLWARSAQLSTYIPDLSSMMVMKIKKGVGVNNELFQIMRPDRRFFESSGKARVEIRIIL